jgi:uncharacterized membrane protein (DUF106 family)
MNLTDPFTAMFVIMAVSFLLSLTSIVVNKIFVYTPEYFERKKIIDSVRKEYMAALRSKDEKQIKKLEKKMQSIKKMEFEQTSKMFKPFIITIGVFWIVYWWLSTVYQDMGAFILSPIPLPFLGYSLNFFGWYIITSIFFGAILRKIIVPEM